MDGVYSQVCEALDVYDPSASTFTWFIVNFSYLVYYWIIMMVLFEMITYLSQLQGIELLDNLEQVVLCGV